MTTDFELCLHDTRGNFSRLVKADSGANEPAFVVARLPGKNVASADDLRMRLVDDNGGELWEAEARLFVDPGSGRRSLIGARVLQTKAITSASAGCRLELLDGTRVCGVLSFPGPTPPPLPEADGARASLDEFWRLLQEISSRAAELESVRAACSQVNAALAGAREAARTPAGTIIVSILTGEMDWLDGFQKAADSLRARWQRLLEFMRTISPESQDGATLVEIAGRLVETRRYYQLEGMRDWTRALEPLRQRRKALERYLKR